MRVLGIAGSLRPGSYNRLLLAAAGRRLGAGAELRTWERLGELPAYAEHLDGDRVAEPVRDLRGSIAGADAVMIATPEYNAAIPGALKNALDWASRPYPGGALDGKPVAVVGASTGVFGAVWAQAQTRTVLATIGARVVDLDLPVGQADDAFDQRGALRDGDLTRRLDEIVAALWEEAGGVARAAA